MDPGRVDTILVESDALEYNWLGDPYVREVAVWSPPPSAGPGPFPVVYGLAGFTGTGAMLLHDGPWSPGLHRRLDRMLAEGRIPPAVVALPDCFTRYGGSQYVDSPATGAYRTHLCEEVIPAVESRFPVRAERDHRYVFGKSSGGFGAISLGMDRPDLFGGVACLSGDMAFEYGYLPDFPKAVDQLVRHGGLEGFLDAFAEAPRKTNDLIATMNIVAMAACYSPDDVRRGAFHLPFELPSGRIREAVWERWLELDPVRRAPECLDALRSLRVLYLECGTRDEFHLHLGARMLHETLEEAAVPHRYEEFDDGHMGIAYRYEEALPALLAPEREAESR